MADLAHAELVEKANKIIAESHVSDSDKALLSGRIPYISLAMLEMFVKVSEEDPFGVDTIVKSLKKKLETQGNLVKLHQVIQQERKEAEDRIALAN
jgi:hypothetical protein